MAAAAGRATRCTPAPLDKALAQVAGAELKNVLTAFHKDRLSGNSSDGAIRIIVQRDDSPQLHTDNSTLHQGWGAGKHLSKVLHI